MQQQTPWQKLLMIMICVCAWLGVALQFVTAVPNIMQTGKTWSVAVLQVCSYFTILTNTLVAVTTTLALLLPRSDTGRWCAKPETITAITVYIVVVGLIYNIVLRPISHFEGWAALGNELVHSVVPLLYILYWLTCATKGSIRWSSAVRWLLYPFLYLIYTFLHGRISNWYPYPFVDVTRIGYGGFWVNSFYMLLLFVALNIILIALDKRIAKARNKKLVT